MASFTGVLKTMFPFISAAAAFGGPLGTMAASAVGNALGVSKVSPTPDGITAALAAAQSKDPDAVLKLQQAEHDFQAQMAKLGFDDAEKLEQLASADRSDARARQIALKDKLPGIMAIVVTGGFFGLLAMLCWHAIPDTAHDVLVAMVGTLGTAWAGIVSYYFGSSAGSAAKNQTISDQLSKQ